MRAMFKLTIANIRAHTARFTFTAVAVALGVGSAVWAAPGAFADTRGSAGSAGSAAGDSSSAGVGDAGGGAGGCGCSVVAPVA